MEYGWFDYMEFFRKGYVFSKNLPRYEDVAILPEFDPENIHTLLHILESYEEEREKAE